MKSEFQYTGGPSGSKHNLIYLLICEELKSRKFFTALQELGLDNSYFQPHLDEIIMRSLNLDAEKNETLDFYFAVMNEHAHRIGISRESVEEEAKAVHTKLTRGASKPGD